MTNATFRSTRRAWALRGLSYATSFVPLAAAHAITGSVTVQVTGQTTHLAALRTAILEAKEAPVCRADVAQIMCVHLGALDFFGVVLWELKDQSRVHGWFCGEWKDQKRMHFLKLVQEIDKTGAATRAHRPR